MKQLVPKNIVGCTQHKSKLFCIRFARQFIFIRCAVMLLFFLTLYNVEARAQFYSVNFVSHAADTLSTSKDPFDAFDGAKVVTNQAIKKQTQQKQPKSAEKKFRF